MAAALLRCPGEGPALALRQAGRGPTGRPTATAAAATAAVGRVACAFGRPAAAPGAAGASACGRPAPRRCPLPPAQAMGGSREANDSSREHEIREISVASNDELLLYFFQQDLLMRLNRAMNMDETEIAQLIRQRLGEVEATMVRAQAAKAARVGSPGGAAPAALAESGLRLRGQLQAAVEAEDYALASTLKNKIAELERASAAARAAADDAAPPWSTFRLGQRVRRRAEAAGDAPGGKSFRGIICGRDPACAESPDWMARAGVAQLARGPRQPFYHLCVDVKDTPGSYHMAYVAEELLQPLASGPDAPPADTAPMDHPYLYLLFLGGDHQGDYLPTRPLRERYGAERRDVFPREPEAGSPAAAGDARGAGADGAGPPGDVDDGSPRLGGSYKWKPEDEDDMGTGADTGLFRL